MGHEQAPMTRTQLLVVSGAQGASLLSGQEDQHIINVEQ